MADAAAPKVKKASKPKKPATHPTYGAMVAKAIGELKERSGSSRSAILKYICKNFNVGANETAVNARLKLALKAGVKKGSLKQVKGTGASGSFKLGEKPKVEKKKPAKKAAAKPKKAKTPKKAAAKKPKAAKSPKKAAAKPKKAKTPKKAAAKPKAAKPAKKAAPKKAKTPKKAAPKAKKPAAKKAAKK